MLFLELVMNNQIIDILEKVLGSGKRLRRGEIAYFCPSCNHRKRKLQVNIELGGRAHCWTCNLRAHNIPQLLKKIEASSELIKEAYRLTREYQPTQITSIKSNRSISLPGNFKPLWKPSNDLLYRHARKYLRTRNIDMPDILRYQLGYCDKGLYENRIIIPSYNDSGSLNYFTGRDFFSNSKLKYKNPPYSRDIVGFELLVSFKYELTITEGPFDAIAIRKNAIPLFGKQISSTLKSKIITQNPPVIIVALDQDAKLDAIKICKELIDLGIKTKLIKLEKDPAEIGFKAFWEIANQTPITSFSDLVRLQLYG